MSEELFDSVQPFSGDLPVPIQETGGALVDAAVQREIAEVQAAMAIAKKFPRNQKQAMDRIMIACQRPTLAERGLYSYARGGSAITGPSIRLAEAIAQNWGNIQFGIRELDQRAGWSTAEAFAWDLETNTRQTKVFQVRHVRKARGNLNILDDPRDIYEMVANQGARRMRACILGIVPGDVVEAAQEQCETTLKASADISTDAVKKMLDKFGEFGISKEMIEKRIQRNIQAITAAQIIGLRKIFNSLRDGMSKPEDWFETVPGTILEMPKEKTKRGRKPKTDLIVESKPKTADEYQPHTKNILSPTSPKAPQAAISPEPEESTAPAKEVEAGSVVSPQDEIRAYCKSLGLTPDKMALQFGADTVDKLNQEQTNKLLNFLVDAYAKSEE